MRSMMATIEISSSTPQLEEEITVASTLLHGKKITTELKLEEENITGASTLQLEEIITEDGIFSLVLSYLTLVEAVRTSVLSSRWRHIWTHLTKFNFDAISVLGIHTLRPNTLAGEEAYDLTKEKTDQFIRSVNSILRHLQGTKVNTFAVQYFLHKIHTAHLDAWIRFALTSKTRCLRLHLFRPYWNPNVQLYDIPCQLLGPSPFLQNLILVSCSIKLPSNFCGFSHLKTLYLADVDLSEEDLNCILSNCCHTLTKLGVAEALQLVAISVPHPLCQLQTLIVRKRGQLSKVEINALNLTELIYQGAPIDFQFRQSSKLTEAHISYEAIGATHNLDFYLTTLSRSMPHLRFLELNLNIADVSQVVNLPSCSRRLIHLTRLELKWDISVEMSLLDLTTLLGVAPFLQELKLQLSKPVLEQQPETPSKPKEMLRKQPHTHLKMIKVSGFYFEARQIEIVAYLLKNATELESMILVKVDDPLWTISEEVSEKGTEILCQEAPENVKLVLL